MTVFKLIKSLLVVLIKHGNVNVHINIEMEDGTQYEAPLGEVAISLNPWIVKKSVHVELLSKGFT